MKRFTTLRRFMAVSVSLGALAALSAGPASADVTTGAVTKTFSFVAKASSSTRTVVNIDSLLINARCDSSGRPIVYAFSTTTGAADIFGRVFDGYGRVHIFKHTSFTSKTKGIQLSPLSGDFDATGSVLFETATGKVVTVSIALDNSPTLVNQPVCTVFGSVIAT